MSEEPITVSINGISHTLTCGLCGKPVTYRIKDDPDASDVGCANCDNWDSRDQAVKIAFDYAKDEGQMILNRMAKEAARKSKFMTFKGQTVSNNTYRFTVADLKI